MKANLLVKSLLHLVSATLTLSYAWWSSGLPPWQWWLLLLAGSAFVALIFLHPRLHPRHPFNTSIFLLLQSAVLAFIAWSLYQQGYHKATFLYEGVSVLYLSLAAFNFLLRRKSTVFFTEAEQQELKQ